MKNILVAIDLESLSSNLIDLSISQAKLYKAKLWVIHVAAPDPDFVGYAVGPEVERDLRAKKLHEERKQLDNIALRVKEKGVDCEALLIQGSTIKTILEEIERLNIDMLFTLHKKHDIMYKLIFGNTDLSLIDKVNIPVVIVPALK